MKPSFANELSASFLMFLDHELCYNAQGFVNIINGKLYPSVDPSFGNNAIYQSEFRQWVSDGSVSGVGGIVANSIRHQESTIVKSQNGLKIDYGMGRVFLDDSFPKNLTNLTADFSRKEFNLFLTSKDEMQLLMEDPGYFRQSTSGPAKNIEPYPLIYVKNFDSENRPFAFGGMDESEYEFRCTILSDNSFKLDSVSSVLQDSARKTFPLIPSSGIPFNIFGDCKNNLNYNYFNVCEEYKSSPVYIESVRVSKFEERLNKVIKDGVWGGVVDFKLKCIRYPRRSE
jgi:hypothetical protein